MGDAEHSDEGSDYAPTPADDAVDRAQDAFFAGDLGASAAACEEAIALSPSDSGAHSLLATVRRQLADHRATADACARWGRLCGPSAQQLKARGGPAAPLRCPAPQRLFLRVFIWLIEALYYEGRAEEAAEAARSLAAHRPRRNEPMSLYNKISAASMVADMGLAAEAEAILSGCVQQEVPEGYEDPVSLLVQWIERCRDPRELPDGLVSLAAGPAAPAADGDGDDSFANDVAALARSLVAAHWIDAGDVAEARRALGDCEGSTDANVCAVRALLAAREGRDEEAETMADLAVLGANPLLLRRVNVAVGKGAKTQ
eukprot:m51a1_g412 hypothetical protein (315) ;mRNA; f:767096-768463